MQRLINIAHPLRKPGYFLPHVALGAAVGLLFLSGVALGWFAGSRYTAAYFRSHFDAPALMVPHTHLHVPTSGPTSFPATGGIDLSLYPAVGDQGNLGACAAWAAAWSASYEFHATHRHSTITFSPRWLYDHFSDAYNGGQDGGSWPDQDIEIADTVGLLQYKALPEPPYVIDNPFPTTDAYGHSAATDAAKHRLNIVPHQLTPIALNQGPSFVDAVKGALSGATTVDGKSHPVLLSIQVFPPFDGATQTGGLIYGSMAGYTSRGGHEIVALRYDDSMRFPNGDVGGVEIQNQWTAFWGAQGRAWISYRALEGMAFDAEYFSIGGSTGASAPPPFLPNPAPVHQHPGTSTTPTPPGAVVKGSAGWYVKDVPGYVNGRTIDLAPMINAAGDKYNIWPVGVAATVYTESAGNVLAYRWVYGTLDKSCGLMQQIVANVISYGYASDELSACQWEYDPAHSIDLGARMLRECYDYHGGRIGFPYLYVGYNAGCAWPDSFFYNPTASDVVAHLQAFVGNYNYALAHWQGGSPPSPPKPPKPLKKAFPINRWSAWRTSHHKPLIAPRWHGHLSWVAGVWRSHKRECRGVVNQGSWHPRGPHGRNGYFVQHFAGCQITVWSHHPHWKPTVKKR